jgi:hypothetical protein
VQEFVANADFDAAEAQLALVQQGWTDMCFSWIGPGGPPGGPRGGDPPAPWRDQMSTSDNREQPRRIRSERVS